MDNSVFKLDPPLCKVEECSFDPPPEFNITFFDVSKKEDFEDKPSMSIFDAAQMIVDDGMFTETKEYATPYTMSSSETSPSGSDDSLGGHNVNGITDTSGIVFYEQKPIIDQSVGIVNSSKPSSHKPFVKPDQSTAVADSYSSTPSKQFVPCKVCGDKASGYHYGVTSCEGCKGFFRRSIQKQIEYRCLRDGKCLIIRLNRNRCQFCRFKKCLSVGMSRDSVRYGRVPKRARESNEENAVMTSEADQSVRQIEKQQLLTYDLTLSVSQAHHCNCTYTEDRTRGLIRKPAVFNAASDNIEDDEDCPDSVQQQKINMWQNFALYVTPSIQRVVEFAKRIPGFPELTQDDQIVLVKWGFFEIWLVQISRMFNTLDNTLTFSDGSYVTRKQLELVFDHEFVTGMFSFAASFNNLGLNDTEIGILSAVMLYTSDRPAITNHKPIEQAQDQLVEALKVQMSRNHVGEAHLFSQVLMSLPEIRGLGASHSQHLQWVRVNYDKIRLPPLYSEIFDIGRYDEDDM